MKPRYRFWLFEGLTASKDVLESVWLFDSEWLLAMEVKRRGKGQDGKFLELKSLSDAKILLVLASEIHSSFYFDHPRPRHRVEMPKRKMWKKIVVAHSNDYADYC